jgi:hypothetical protein
MGKLSHKSSSKRGGARNELTRLLGERRKLWSRLSLLEKQIAKLSLAKNGAKVRTKSPGVAEFERWLDAMSAGLPELPPLPGDFSRADLYDDHD